MAGENMEEERQYWKLSQWEGRGGEGLEDLLQEGREEWQDWKVFSRGKEEERMVERSVVKEGRKKLMTGRSSAGKKKGRIYSRARTEGGRMLRMFRKGGGKEVGLEDLLQEEKEVRQG